MGKTNHIVEAYEQGKRIKLKGWTTSWIKKHDYRHSIDDRGGKGVNDWSFDIYPKEWEIHPEDIEPETPKNPIVEAYNAGKRIRRKDWTSNEWIKKHSEDYSICDLNIFGKNWNFDTYPENWEILPDAIEPEDVELEEPQTEIQKAIKLLIENNYEVYFITKTQIVL
jgi:hypothetical protein